MKPDYNRAIADLTAGLGCLVRQVEAETGVVVKQIEMRQIRSSRGISSPHKSRSGMTND